MRRHIFFCSLFIVCALQAQTFRRVLHKSDLEVGAHYLLAAKTTDADSVYVIRAQSGTGLDIKNREAKKLAVDNECIRVEDDDIAVFELGENGTAYTFKDVALEAYLSYSVANVSNGKSALYTLTEEELKAQPTSGNRKFSNAFVYKDLSVSKHKSVFLTKEKINNSASGVQFVLAPEKNSGLFRLYEKKDYTDSLYIYKEILPPTIEGWESGNWIFKGEWTADKLSAYDFSLARSIDFTSIALPSFTSVNLPAEGVLTYVAKGVMGQLPAGWGNVIEITDKSANIKGEVATDIIFTDATSAFQYSFYVPEGKIIAYVRNVADDQGWHTLALPYVPQQVRWDGTQGENAAMEWLRCDMIDADKVVFEPFIESMSRNMPYLCRPQSPRSGRLYFCASDVNIAADVAADVPTQTGFYANATRTEITGDEQVYLLADDGMTFVRAAQGSWIAPRRAYVVLSDMSMVNLRIHIMEQTSMHHPTAVGQETYYDLSGVYVGKKKKDAPFPADWKKGVLISSDGKVVMNAVK